MRRDRLRPGLSASPRRRSRRPRACFSAKTGDAKAVGSAHPTTRQTILNACVIGSCWAHSTTPARQTQCDYSRGGSLTLRRDRSTRTAQDAVHKALRKGYKPVNVGAYSAGIVVGPKGGGVVMAVGRTFALYALGASSDTNPNPAWAGVKPRLLAGARKIAQKLRQAGCPARPRACR